MPVHPQQQQAERARRTPHHESNPTRATAWADGPESETATDGAETRFGFSNFQDTGSPQLKRNDSPTLEVQPVIQALETCELPEPPEKKHAWAKTLRSAICGVVTKALPMLAGKAAESLPFGPVAVALCDEAATRAKLLRENREAAQELGRHARKIAKHGRWLVVYFEQTGDEDGLDEAKELLEHTFCSFRLVADASKKGVKSVVLRFLNCNDLASGMEQAKRRLVDAVGLTNLIFNAAQVRAKETATSTTPRIIRECSARDAAGFWKRMEFGRNKVDAEELLDALDLYLELGDDLLVSDNERVRDALTRNGKAETVTATRFALFLKGSSSIAEAVQKHMPSATALKGNATTAADAHDCLAPKRSVRRHASRRPAGDDDLSSINGRLRRVLSPVDFGRDQVRHEEAFAEGTRQWVFHAFEQWAALPPTQDHRRVFWVKGTGGVGKSVIAAQLVKRYGGEEGDVTERPSAGSKARPLIAAHFFCKHDHADRNDPRRAIATLVFRLASQLPELWQVLQRVLLDEQQEAEFTAHAGGSRGSLEDAFEVLLARPLQTALRERSGSAGDVFILVDALDELRTGASRHQLLQLVGKQLPSLPPSVRIVVTSRPEEDIEAFFNRLDPFTIDKKHERQKQDMQLFVRQQIVQQTSLATLGKEQQEQAVRAIVERADGVFLAVRLMARAIMEADDATEHALTPVDVERLLRTYGASVIDATYTETLDRIQARLNDAAGGDTEVLQTLQQSLRNILAAIVASRQPLRVQDLHEMCGGVRSASKALTQRLTSALSLLFSTSQHGVIEPLHKTVVDYLTDQQRAGDQHFVDELEGHATLAMASLRVLQDRGLLAKARGLVDPEEIDEAVTRYSIEHGHMHLKACAQAMRKDETGDAMCQQALEAWQSVFLQPRRKNEPALKQFTMDNITPTGREARVAFGAWLLLQVSTAERGRILLKELTQLAGALSGAGDNVPDLAELVDHTSRLYGANWAPKLGTEDGLTSGAATFGAEVPLTSPLFASAGSKHVTGALRQREQLMRIPNVLVPNPCMLQIRGRTKYVTSVGYSPDGKRIVSGSSDNTVCVWDADTGQQLAQCTGHAGTVRSVRYSPDGKRIVSGSHDKTVRVWDADTGQQLAQCTGHTGTVMSVGYSPNGKRIVSGSHDKTVRVWDTDTGQQLAQCTGHTGTVNSVGYSPDGKRIVSGSDDNTVRVWDTDTGQQLAQCTEHTADVNSVGHSPDGKRIVSGSLDKTVRVWDVDTGKQLAQCTGHTEPVYSVGYSPVGKRIVLGSRDSTVREWDADTGQQLTQCTGHTGTVRSVGYSPDGKRIVSGSGDKTVRVWDADTGQQLAQCTGHTDPVFSVGYSADGKRIVSGSLDKTVRVWDADTGQQLAQCTGHTDPVFSVGYSADGKRIVSGSGDNTVHVWDADTGQQLAQCTGHTGWVLSVGYSPDRKRIVSGSLDKTVRVWDADTGKQLAQCTGHTGTVFSVGYSPDGKRIVSGGEDNTVRVWHADTGQQLAQRNCHTGPVRSVGHSPDGKRIVSGSDDSTVRVWDADTGKQLSLKSAQPLDDANDSRRCCCRVS